MAMLSAKEFSRIYEEMIGDVNLFASQKERERLLAALVSAWQWSKRHGL